MATGPGSKVEKMSLQSFSLGNFNEDKNEFEEIPELDIDDEGVISTTLVQNKTIGPTPPKEAPIDKSALI